jgi:hypothetical protein
VSAPRISRLRRIPSLATLLLVLQAVAGGAVTLADAREPLTVASHIEAQHEPGCPVVHDALRCALCHYAGIRVVVQQTATTAQDHPVPMVAPRLDPVLVVAVAVHFTASPRAPPLFLS